MNNKKTIEKIKVLKSEEEQKFEDKMKFGPSNDAILFHGRVQAYEKVLGILESIDDSIMEEQAWNKLADSYPERNRMSKKEELLKYLKDHEPSERHSAMVLINREYIVDIVEELMEPKKIKVPIWVVSNANGKRFRKFTGEGVSGVWVSSNIIPYMFDEREKAEAVALLTGGTVELVKKALLSPIK